jgi:hypothetical protein
MTRGTPCAAAVLLQSAGRRSRAFSAGGGRAPLPVFVDGVRLPFAMSGTTYKDEMAVDLGKLAMKGLLDRHPEMDPSAIDYLLYGTVIQESRTSNIARDAALAAGVGSCLLDEAVTIGGTLHLHGWLISCSFLSCSCCRSPSPCRRTQ